MTIEITNKSGGNVQMMIYGRIGSTPFEEGVEDLEIVNQVREATNSAKDIDVHINSPGGSVFVGQAIYTALSQTTATVTTFNDAFAGSIAGVILMAGGRRVAAAGSKFMMHPPAAGGGSAGTANELRSVAESLDKVLPDLVDIYAKGGEDKATIEAMMLADEGRGTFLNTQEQVDHGFATEIAGNTVMCAPNLAEGFALPDSIFAWAKDCEKHPMIARNFPNKARVAGLIHRIRLTKLRHKL